MMNALEYYYSVIAPEEQGKNYQQTHQYENYLSWGRSRLSPLEQEPDFAERWEAILNYIPDKSNDAHLNWVLTEMGTEVGQKVKERLNNTFLAKRNDLQFNAYAIDNIQEYNGDLVFFYVGLSDACFQYSILFAEFLKLRIYKLEQGENEGEDDRTFLELALNYTKHLLQISKAQSKWQLYGEYIKLDEETVIRGSRDIELEACELAAKTDMFLVGHEVAHHLLGETGRDDIGSEILELLPLNCQMWRGKIQSHSDELKADALALLLVAHAADSAFWKNPKKNDYALHAAVGSLLALTVLGQVSPDPNKPSDSHPSTKDRQEQCKRILKILTPTRKLNIVEYDMLDFQWELFLSQGHGLGVNIKELFEPKAE